jgi:hypothetical protein
MLELNFNSSDSLFTEKWKERRQFVGRLILVRGRGKNRHLSIREGDFPPSGGVMWGLLRADYFQR